LQDEQGSWVFNVKVSKYKDNHKDHSTEQIEAKRGRVERQLLQVNGFTVVIPFLQELSYCENRRDQHAA